MSSAFFTILLASLLLAVPAPAQSVSLPGDRARVKVASIPDFYGGPNLKVLRTDTNTPLRAGTAWIWEKQGQEEPASYYVSGRSKGLNTVRMILFDTWEKETYTPGPIFTPTDWNDPAYRSRQLARMERPVNYASAKGMYISTRNPPTIIVASGADDAEKSVATGVVSLTSTDLELVDAEVAAAGLQRVGLRFAGVALPPGATIVDARLYFTADESQSGPMSPGIAAQAANNAAAFTATAWNLTDRPRTATSVPWQPAAWTAAAADPAQQSPNLAAIGQEIVDHPGWTNDNALAFLINGTGHRTADACGKSGSTPARLTLTFYADKPPTSYTRWMSSHPNLTGSQTLANDDPDFDGFDNLMEYALATPPNRTNSVGPTAGIDSGWLLLTYTRPALMPDISYQVEWSETLGPAEWSAANVQQFILSDDGLTRTVRAGVPIGSSARGFLRPKVLQRPQIPPNDILCPYILI